MTEQEHNNRRFARELATVCYYDTANMNKCPIVLNSQQYRYFVEEWNKLNKKKCANVTDLEYRRVNGFERGMYQ